MTEHGADIVVTRGPDPDPEELAAIVAAVQVAATPPPPAAEKDAPVPRWRFSGRWWSRPIPSRRDRPAAW